MIFHSNAVVITEVDDSISLISENKLNVLADHFIGHKVAISITQTHK